MNIAVLSIACDKSLPEGQLTFPNKIGYCRRHGYDWIGLWDNPSERNPSWGKIPLMLSALEKFDAVLWTDCDSIFTNPSITVESILALSIGADLFVAKELNPSGYYTVNCGVMLARPTPGLRAWFDATWREYPPWGLWHEQSAMLALLGRGVDRELGVKIHYPPKNTFNSYPSDWGRNDFIVHYPGVENRLPKMAARLAAIRAGIGASPLPAAG